MGDGDDLHLNKLFGYEQCNHFISCSVRGNWDQDRRVPCNATWNSSTEKRYCSSPAKFNASSLKEVIATQRWRSDESSSPVFAKRLEKLWLTSKNMLSYQPPKPFHIFAHATVNPGYAYGATIGFEHHWIFIQQWAEFADKAGINYTVFWLPYVGATPGLPMLKHSRERDHCQDVTDGTQMHYASSSDLAENLLRVFNFTMPFRDPVSPYRQHGCKGNVTTTLNNAHLHLAFVCVLTNSCQRFSSGLSLFATQGGQGDAVQQVEPASQYSHNFMSRVGMDTRTTVAAIGLLLSSAGLIAIQVRRCHQATPQHYHRYSSLPLTSLSPAVQESAGMTVTPRELARTLTVEAI